jgi:hypothetical protein
MKRTALALELSAVVMSAIVMGLGTGCTVVVTGSQTYETCGTTSDCASSLDSCFTVTTTEARSMCTRACATDLDCPGSGRCMSFDAGRTFLCFEGCATSAQCEPGWSCFDSYGGTFFSPICLPGRGAPPPATQPPYYECTIGSTRECVASVEGCFTIAVDGVTRGMCTSRCRSDVECPRDRNGALGVCMSFDGGFLFSCFQACRSSLDCPLGFACKSRLADGTTFAPICLPS